MAQPVELILARNLISEISLAALVCDPEGAVVFFNDAAGELLGRRFDELGPLTHEEWNANFVFRDAPLRSSPQDHLPSTAIAGDGHPQYGRTRLQGRADVIDAEFVEFPLSTIEGLRGAIVLLWPAAAAGTSGA